MPSRAVQATICVSTMRACESTCGVPLGTMAASRRAGGMESGASSASGSVRDATILPSTVAAANESALLPNTTLVRRSACVATSAGVASSSASRRAWRAASTTSRSLCWLTWRSSPR